MYILYTIVVLESRGVTPNQLRTNTVEFLYNPSSGDTRDHDRFKRERESVEERLREQGFVFPVRFSPTRSLTDTRDRVHAASEEDRGLLIVKGGDGTLSDVAHNIARIKDPEKRPHILSIGGGTENVFQNTVTSDNRRYPVGIFEENFVHGRPKAVDVGEFIMDDVAYPFLTNAGIGKDAHTLHEWEQLEKGRPRKRKSELFKLYQKHKGGYAPHTFDVSGSRREQDVEMQVEDALSLLFINAGYYGGKFHITDSQLGDGQLDMVGLHTNVKSLLQLGRILFKGPSSNLVTRGIIDQATVRTHDPHPQYFQHDGETEMVTSDTLHVGVIPQSVTVWVGRHV